MQESGRRGIMYVWDFIGEEERKGACSLKNDFAVGK